MPNRRMRVYLTSVIPLALVLASGCWRRTELAAVWHTPSPTLLNFDRTVTIFASTDETMRRVVEDQIAQKFPRAAPSYGVIPRAAEVDKSKVLEQMRGAGFDGAIVMRLVNVTQQVDYVYNGGYWGAPYGFAGYWGDAWASPYNPGYSTSTIYTVETNVYSLKDDKLVFAAVSQTTDPSNVGKLVRSIMRHVNEQMKKDGMLASAPASAGEGAVESAELPIAR